MLPAAAEVGGAAGAARRGRRPEKPQSPAQATSSQIDMAAGLGLGRESKARGREDGGQGLQGGCKIRDEIDVAAQGPLFMINTT